MKIYALIIFVIVYTLRKGIKDFIANHRIGECYFNMENDILYYLFNILFYLVVSSSKGILFGAILYIIFF